MTREILPEELPKEIQKDAPFISDGFLSEIDALEESADRAERKGAAEPEDAKDHRPKAD